MSEEQILDQAGPVAELVERDAWLDLFDAAPREVRRRLGLASIKVAGTGLLSCRAIPITELNRAMAIGIESDLSREEMEAVVAWLDANSPSWALQIPPTSQTTTISDFAEASSLQPAGLGWAKFVSVRQAPAPMARSPAVQVEIAGAAEAESFGCTIAQGFGLPDECASWFAALAGRPSWLCLLATIDGETAGGGAVFVKGDAAWHGIEATLPAFRGRGVQQGVIARQLDAAAASGARIHTCETAQPGHAAEPGFSSYRNQERAGFERAYVRANLRRPG